MNYPQPVNANLTQQIKTIKLILNIFNAIFFLSTYRENMIFISILPGAQENTTGKERATPTQLIKIAKARHLVGVTIFRCSTWPHPPQM